MTGRVKASAATLFFEEAWAGFEAASQRNGCIDQALNVRGKGLRLSFAGAELAHDIGSAFAHLAGAVSPAFHIRIWDSSGKGLPVLKPPFQIPAHDGAAVHLYREQGIRIACFVSPEGISFSMMDAQSLRGIFWTPDASQLLYGDYASPLLTLMSWWLADTGRQMVHGAAVGCERGGLLIGGANGSGKTTLSLTCLTEKLGFGGDDRMALEERDGVFSACSIYSSVKLGAQTLNWFPDVAACSAGFRQPGPKTLCFLHPRFQGLISNTITLKAIVFPMINSELSHPLLERMSPGESFRRLVPSTVLQMPGATPSDLSFLNRFCRSLPGYALHLGSDRQASAGLVRKLIASNGVLREWGPAS